MADTSIVSRQVHSYQVATPVFEGPLDLLLLLIERAELDITKLALAEVTDQFLVHIRSLEQRTAEEVSAFLIIAVKLIQIKSEVLLPRPPTREEGEDDPGEALARQLIIYRRYRRIADFLATREFIGKRTHLRLSLPPKVEGVLDMSGLGIDDLVIAAREILNKVDTREELRTVVRASAVTIREKIGQIVNVLQMKGRASFRALIFSARSRLEIVVTFLAMLELIKQHKIQATQEQNFGEIDVKPADAWDPSTEFELEFGE